MGASLSQPTQHLPGDVLANIKRSKDRDYRFRMALSCHQRFYKHFDPAKLVLNRTEFCAVFAPAYGDPALHFAHLDAHGRGRVSSFEALADFVDQCEDWTCVDTLRREAELGKLAALLHHAVLAVFNSECVVVVHSDDLGSIE